MSVHGLIITCLSERMYTCALSLCMGCPPYADPVTWFNHVYHVLTTCYHLHTVLSLWMCCRPYGHPSMCHFYSHENSVRRVRQDLTRTQCPCEMETSCTIRWISQSTLQIYCATRIVTWNRMDFFAMSQYIKCLPPMYSNFYPFCVAYLVQGVRRSVYVFLPRQTLTCH